MENKLIIRQEDKILCQHPDDLKPYSGKSEPSKNHSSFQEECSESKESDEEQWPTTENVDYDTDSYLFQPAEADSRLVSLRYSSRLRKENKRLADYILQQTCKLLN